MTVQVSKSAATGDKVAVLDGPIFDPRAFRLNDEQASIIARARELGQTVFAGRAAAYDRDAVFPIENYRDLHRAGLLGISIPKKHGGLGADYQTYALAAAEIGRYCRADLEHARLLDIVVWSAGGRSRYGRRHPRGA